MSDQTADIDRNELPPTTTPENVTITPRAPRKPKVRYGDREMEVLTLVSHGVKYDEIAVKLEISIDTVKGHLKRIYRKLGAKSGPNAVSIAIGRGMLAPAPFIPPAPDVAE